MELIQLVDVIAVDKQIIVDALYSDFKDFEDAVQNMSAIGGAVDCIVTRNVKDYVSSDLEVLAPAEFLEKYMY